MSSPNASNMRRSASRRPVERSLRAPDLPQPNLAEREELQDDPVEPLLLVVHPREEQELRAEAADIADGRVVEKVVPAAATLLLLARKAAHALFEKGPRISATFVRGSSFRSGVAQT